MSLDNLSREELISLLQAKKMKIKKLNKKWYETHKDYHKKRYQERKQYVECECGAKILKTSEGKHLKSNKHIKSMAMKQENKE